MAKAKVKAKAKSKAKAGAVVEAVGPKTFDQQKVDLRTGLSEFFFKMELD